MIYEPASQQEPQARQVALMSPASAFSASDSAAMRRMINLRQAFASARGFRCDASTHGTSAASRLTPIALSPQAKEHNPCGWNCQAFGARTSRSTASRTASISRAAGRASDISASVVSPGLTENPASPSLYRLATRRTHLISEMAARLPRCLRTQRIAAWTQIPEKYSPGLLGGNSSDGDNATHPAKGRSVARRGDPGMNSGCGHDAAPSLVEA